MLQYNFQQKLGMSKYLIYIFFSSDTIPIFQPPISADNNPISVCYGLYKLSLLILLCRVLKKNKLHQVILVKQRIIVSTSNIATCCVVV